VVTNLRRTLLSAMRSSFQSKRGDFTFSVVLISCTVFMILRVKCTKLTTTLPRLQCTSHGV
jgi:hypothetical protein